MAICTGLKRYLDNQYERDEFVISELKKIPAGSLLLDAGCGSQRYRSHCGHLSYKAQDFGQYTTDDKKMLGTEGVGGADGYHYGRLDYLGDVWDIAEKDGTFDAVMCTEVFEHIPYPNETIREFARLLKRGGRLILTAPSNCLRHMDPYFFYTGFSDRWYETVLARYGFIVEKIEPVGDYYRWIAVELVRAARSQGVLAKLLLIPAFFYFYSKRASRRSIDTLCMGYNVIAKKS